MHSDQLPDNHCHCFSSLHHNYIIVFMLMMNSHVVLDYCGGDQCITYLLSCYSSATNNMDTLKKLKRIFDDFRAAAKTYSDVSCCTVSVV